MCHRLTVWVHWSLCFTVYVCVLGRQVLDKEALAPIQHWVVITPYNVRTGGDTADWDKKAFMISLVKSF